MTNRRKWTLFIGAVMAAGFAASGCTEDDAVFEPGGNPANAPSACKDATSCANNPDCAEGDGALACKCVTEDATCHSNASCNGVGSCQYTCVVGTTCNSYAGCASDPVCKGGTPGPVECDKSLLLSDGDQDGDGIPNGVEIGSSLNIDPCNSDSDGDTIPDGEEDLNHNGIYEPEYGETNPGDASDPADSSSVAGKDKIEVKKKVCNAEMLKGNEEALKSFRVAKLKTAQYVGANTGTLEDYVVFDDSSTKVAGAFIGWINDQSSGKELLYAGFNSHKDVVTGYIEESNFGSPVPSDTWLKNKIYARETPTSDLNKNLYQVVPDHRVDRYKYHLTLAEGTKLSDVRDLLVNENMGSTLQSSNALGTCENNSAIVYIARSAYALSASETVYIYSIAMTCDSDASNVATKNMMDDVISGTLVAGSTIYYPYKNYLCQQEQYGKASGSVDFLWVIDNSGSMKDELDNLSKTLDVFLESLSSSGIDYHLGVTTTDAYTIDEYPAGYQMDNYNEDVAYLEPTGLIHGIKTAQAPKKCMFFDSDSKAAYQIKTQITERLNCENNGVSDSNICGYGLEDGLKSGAETLHRLFTNSESVDEDAEIYNAKVSYACKENETTCNTLARCMLRSSALKYVIFVSDEESRQFKEVAGPPTAGTKQKYYDSDLSELKDLCATGYKLEGDAGEETNILNIVYSMPMGTCAGLGTTASVPTVSVEDKCNPTLKSQDLVNLTENPLREDMSPEEVKTVSKDYYNMLMYYIQQYNKYAGEGGIAAFALVGDIGSEKGGACTELGDSSGATEGANYGISYIHLARYLGALDSNGGFTGKSGGFGSICNTNYETTVNSIFEDVQGRVASHPLRGYPISSTIRVAVAHDGVVTELERGASKNGWNYDASQNAIVFSGAKLDSTDEIAISYVIWTKNEG